MSLPKNLFATAFRQQRLGLMLATIMAIMVYLATLAMAIPASLAQTTLAWDHAVAGRLTVEIPPASEEDGGVAQAGRVKQVVAALKAMPDVAQVDPVAAAETLRLIKPWVRDPALLVTLPLPQLIDVQAAENKTIDAEGLRQKLEPFVKGVQVDAHADWLAQWVRVARGVSVLAALTVVLAGLTLMMVVSLICRAAMAVQHETIELLHLLGATHADVARQFQRHAFHLAWPAAVVGFLCAVVTAGILGALLRFFVDQPFTPDWRFAVVLGLVPLAAIAGAMMTARFSVLRLLRRMP